MLSPPHPGQVAVELSPVTWLQWSAASVAVWVRPRARAAQRCTDIHAWLSSPCLLCSSLGQCSVVLFAGCRPSLGACLCCFTPSGGPLYLFRPGFNRCMPRTWTDPFAFSPSASFAVSLLVLYCAALCCAVLRDVWRCSFGGQGRCVHGSRNVAFAMIGCWRPTPRCCDSGSCVLAAETLEQCNSETDDLKLEPTLLQEVKEERVARGLASVETEVRQELLPNKYFLCALDHALKGCCLSRADFFASPQCKVLTVHEERRLVRLSDSANDENSSEFRSVIFDMITKTCRFEVSRDRDDGGSADSPQGGRRGSAAHWQDNFMREPSRFVQCQFRRQDAK